MASGVSVNLGTLFQNPKKWTPRDLLGLNVQEHHRVSAAVIVGDDHLPGDDNPWFMDLAGDFVKPTKQEILSNSKYPESKLRQCLSSISSARVCFEDAYPPYSALYNLAILFLLHMDKPNRLAFSCLPIPFHLPSLNIKGSLKGTGAYFTTTDEESSLPLTIFIARKGPESQSAAHEVAPYLLFQVLLAYERNPDLENYTGFVVSMKGTVVQFTKAVCSRVYIQDLIKKSPGVPGFSLEIYFSEPYDLLEQDGRKEFLRMHLGLIQSLYDLSRLYNI